MKLWMSAEVDADVGDAHRHARNAVEPAVNRALEGISFSDQFGEWAFLSIIVADEVLPGFPEIVRKSSKGKVLEFRLQIHHAEFKQASPEKKMAMLFDALSRSVDLMSKLKVSQESQEKFRTALTQARGTLLAE